MPDRYQQLITLIPGHALDVLPLLDAGSVQCVVTSPPYWGLRDYKLPATVWGGEAGCEHEWGGVLPPRPGRGNKPGDLSTSSLTNPERQDTVGRAPDSGAFCRRCNAWRGSLGLEPTPELYVEHIITVFRAVRRVLRADGVLWLNLGDSYYTQGTGELSLSGEKKLGQTNRGGYTGYKPRSQMSGLKPKDLIGIPWRVALALQADGWWLRSDIIWSKPNPIPESVTDRPTKAHEYVFLLTKSARYFWDQEAVREKSLWPDGPNSPGYIKSPHGQGFTRRAAKDSGTRKELHGPTYSRHRSGVTGGQDLRANPVSSRNIRSVWTIATAPFAEAHFATFPPKLVEPMIKAGTSERGCCPECGAPWYRDKDDPTIWHPGCECSTTSLDTCTALDPFCGSGTVGEVCLRLNRQFVGIDLSEPYLEMSERRIKSSWEKHTDKAAAEIKRIMRDQDA